MDKQKLLLGANEAEDRISGETEKTQFMCYTHNSKLAGARTGTDTFKLLVLVLVIDGHRCGQELM